MAGVGWAVLAAFFALWLIPALGARRHGHQFQVAAHGQIEVPTSLAACSAWIRDAHHLALYEAKVDRCEVESQRGRTIYTCFGRFFGVPWTGTFSMEHTRDGGFHSVMIAGPHQGNADGGFRLKALPTGTRVTHYERYRINVWLPFVVLARPLIQRWLDRTIAGEMVIITDQLGALGAPSGWRSARGPVGWR